MKARIQQHIKLAGGDLASITVEVESDSLSANDLLRLCGSAGVGATALLRRRNGQAITIEHGHPPRLVKEPE